MTRCAVLLFALCAGSGSCMKAPDPAGMNGPAPAETPRPQVEFAAPEGWTAVAADQSFYLAKWEVAGGGVATLSWLGPGAGQEFIVSNVQRWLGEWQQPDGAAVVDYQFETVTHGGRKTHRIALSGTLTGTRQLGGGDPRAGWGLFGAVVESESGPLFLKFIGPAEVVAAGTAPAWNALAELKIAQGE